MALAVTGLGLICSVGHTVESACAAIRADVSVPRELIEYTVIDEETQSPEFVKGHPLEGFSEGFASLGRLLHLAIGAIEDLCRQAALPDPADTFFWGRTGLIIVLPTLDPTRFLEAAGDVAELRRSFGDQLATMLGLALKANEIHVFDRGAAGVAHAIHLVEQRHIHTERYLIVAADSYVDPDALEWLDEHDRLKTGSNPCGVMPGEAAAALLVESRSTADARRAQILAMIGPAAFGQEPNHFFSDSPNSGEALAQAIGNVVRAAIQGGQYSGDVIIDLNGEVWRAAEWGNAQIRAADVLGPLRLVMPKSSVGDVGAASGILAVCVAARASNRGYAKASRTLVVGSSEHGDVGALMVETE